MRKLRELLYAVEMERTLGKPRILRLYLDNAPWGPRLCGAEAAAAHYFGVRAHELTPGAGRLAGGHAAQPGVGSPALGGHAARSTSPGRNGWRWACAG